MNKPGSSTNSTIQSYRKRQQQGPMFAVIAAIVLALAGIIFLIVWLTGPSKPLDAVFATDTPTPTLTFTPTNTSTPTPTSTETATPTITNTPTPSGPFEYTVQEGEYLFSIVEKFQLGPDGVALILLLNNYSSEAADFSINPQTQAVYPNQKIWIPNPDMELPTATPIPTGLPRGTKINYTVQSGDTLAGIAALFNSTEEAIIKENKIEDANKIKVGDVLVIPINIVTPTATRPPTSTPSTRTPDFLITPSVTPTFTKAP